MLEVQTRQRKNHYDTLSVPRNASKREIQTSFRRLVKIYHPDKNPDRTEWAETRMRELLQAYETVSDDQSRLSYDREMRSAEARASFAERMAKKKDDPAAQSRLVLHYLLQGRFEEALDLHERLRSRRPTFNLASHLDERDYRDTLFLLGEAYESRRQWRTAVRFYQEAYEREKSGPRMRYYFDEVRDRLRILLSQRLVRGLPPEDAIKTYQRALELDIGKRESALIYKKIASLEDRLGRRQEAVKALDKAKNLCPGMRAIETMRKRIAGA